MEMFYKLVGVMLSTFIVMLIIPWVIRLIEKYCNFVERKTSEWFDA